jgi:hypothetical protein
VCLVSFCLLSLSFSPPSPRGPSSAASPHSVSHASRKRRFSPTFPLPCPTLPSSPVDQAPALAACSLYSISSIRRVMGIFALRSSRCCCDRLRASTSCLCFFLLVPACSGLGPVAPAPSPCSAQPSSSSVSDASSALRLSPAAGSELITSLLMTSSPRLSAVVHVGGIGIARDANEAGSVVTRFTLPVDVLVGSETSSPASPILGDSATANEKVLRHPPI